MWLDAVYLVTLGAVHAMLSSVLSAALHVYADRGTVPPPFAANLLASAVAPK